VGWWKSINDIFSLCITALDKMKSKLYAVYQFKGEKLVPCYTRFKMKVCLSKFIVFITTDIFEYGLVFRSVADFKEISIYKVGREGK